MKTKNKICHISSAHPRTDIRIFQKECMALQNSGFDVSLLIADGLGDGEKSGIKIYDAGKAGSRLARFTTIFYRIYKKAKEIDADVFHFHDPELMFLGYFLKLRGKKVIYDIHEDVPKDIMIKYWIPTAFLRGFVKRAYIILERLFVRKFDLLITVSEEIGNNYSSYREKVLIIRNVAIVKAIDQSPVSKEPKNKSFVLLYQGGLNPVRGIREIVESMQYVDGATLWLFGNWSSEEFKSECEKLDGYKKVKYFGFIPSKDLYGYTKLADICIINFLPLPHNEFSLPNKIFEYMACKRPVLLSDFPYWRKIFGDAACYADSRDPEKIADAVNFLMKNKTERNRLAAKGRKLVETEFSWERESILLVNSYNKLLKV
jgi:glycosyltransferase involved in cell wall biosynthesis